MTTSTTNLDSRFSPAGEPRWEEIETWEDGSVQELVVAPSPRATSARLATIVTSTLNRLLVSAYKAMGFFILTVILGGLVSYVALNALFFLHTRWLAPAIIAPSDPRVLELRARLAHELWNQKRVATERASIRAELERAQRTMDLEDTYQATFVSAVSNNAEFKKGRLVKARALRRELSEVQARLAQATERFARLHGRALEEASEAHLINRDQRLTGEFRVAELGAKQVTLKGHQATVGSEIVQIAQELQALDTVARDPASSVPATIEGLQLKRSFMNSVLAKENARGEAEALRASDRALQEASEAYDDIIGIMKESPLLLAASGELTVAFVPYTNQADVRAGDEIYGCAVYAVWCRPVGRVGASIEGEIVSKHPLYGNDVRGQFVLLHLDDSSAATQVILHAGRAPLFL